MDLTTPPPPTAPLPPLAPPGMGTPGRDILAAVPTRVATAVVASLAIVIVGVAAEQAALSLVCVVAVLLGIGVGAATGVDRAFRSFSGLGAAFITGGIATVLWALAASQGFEAPPISILVVSGAVLGLDWLYVPRLRTLVFASGILVVPAVGLDRGWTLPAALLWLGLAFVTFWLLEQDQRAALEQLQLIEPSGASRPTAGLDLARTLGIAALVGLTAAFLLGSPSCNLDLDPPDQAPNGGGEYGPGDPGSYGGEGGTGNGGGFGFRDYGLDPDRVERPMTYRDGRRDPLVDSETGERYELDDTIASGRDGEVSVRDQEGREVAVLEDGAVVAIDDEGREQRYERRGDGELHLEGADGETYVLDQRGGRGVLLGPEGESVAIEAQPGDGELEIANPDGSIVADDPDGTVRDTIPIPPPVLGERGWPGGDDRGRSYTYEGDRTTVTDRTGEVRVYDRDEQGRDRFRSEPVDGEPLTFTYDDRSDGKVDVTVTDDDGEVVDRFTLDPNDTDGDGSTGPEPDGQGQFDPQQDQDQKEDQEKDDRGIPWKAIAVGVLVVAALAGLAYWLIKRRRPPRDPGSWAQEMARRLDEEGAERGRPRNPSETVVDYTVALADEPLPDPRLVTVGAVVSEALFDRQEPPESTRSWADTVVSEALEANPRPKATDRFRRNRDRPDT